MENRNNKPQSKISSQVRLTTRPWLYNLREEEMSMLLYARELKQLQKAAYIPRVVVNENTLPLFLEQLKKNIDQFPNPTRLQIEMHDSRVGISGHWLLTDCYIKDGKLNTFTVDAGVVHKAFAPFLNTLGKYFPPSVASHYTLYRDPESRLIQSTDYDCQAFAIEHSELLSKINPEVLYSVLADNFKKTMFSEPQLKEFFKGYDGMSSVHFARIKDLTEETKILAPLFRSMQSYKGVTELPLTFLTENVSIKHQKNLDQWINQKKTNVLLENEKTGEMENKDINRTIREKDFKYGLNLRKHKESDQIVMYRTAIGLVSMPQLLTAEKMLKDITKDQLTDLIKNCIEFLDKDLPKKTEASFLKIAWRGKHVVETNKTIKQLNKILENFDHYKKTQIALHDFLLVLNNFSSYLIENNSKRTIEKMQEYLNGLTQSQEKYSLSRDHTR